MSLVAQSEELSISGYVTIAQGARLKQVNYHALRMWLRLHPDVPTKRVGTVIVVRTDELEKYTPTKVVSVE
jgi:hypothetical protein